MGGIKEVWSWIFSSARSEAGNFHCLEEWLVSRIEMKARRDILKAVRMYISQVG